MKYKFPEVIFLQCPECPDNILDCEYPNCDCEVTWCKDKINDSDIKYVRDKGE